MERRARRMLSIGLGLAAVAGALALLLAWWLPSDAELGARIKAQAEARLGVQVSLGSVRWQLVPWPALVIENAATVQGEPIRFDRLVAQPDIRALLQRQLRFDHVLLEGGVMPQLALRGLRLQPAQAAQPQGVPVAQLRFRNLTWVTRHGKALEFDGNVFFDAGWRPREAEVLRPGVQPLTQLKLQREGDADRWEVQLLLGGGTAHGQVALTPAGDGLHLAGALAPRGVEVESALAAFKRNSAVRGKASGRTVLSADGHTIAELARSLHTRTSFSMQPATVLRLDIDKAIRTGGQDRAGQTPLQSLTGQMDTQNTPDGMVVRYSGLQARGETFSASGHATIANRQVQGELRVDLAGGLVGVPLQFAGPLGAPKVTVPPTAVAGAAAGAVVGTAVLPGIGTAIGASVGAAVGKLFGASAPKK
jgi:hypothetical protein